MKNMSEAHSRLDVETKYETAAIYEETPHAPGPEQLRQALNSLASVAALSSDKEERVPLKENFAWTLAGNAIYAVCQWGILVAIAKLGTPTMVGQFVLGLAVAAPVFMLTSLQLRVVLTIDARNQYRLGHYIAPRLLGTAVGLVVITSFVFVSHLHRDTAVVVLLVGVAKAVETLSDIIYGFWQKHERFDKIAIALTGRGIGSVAIMTGVLYFTRSMAFAAAATALYWFVWLATYERHGTKNLLESVSPKEVLRAEWERGKCGRLVMLSLPLGLVMLLVSLNTNIPRYFVEHFCGESALGYFAAMAYTFTAGNTVMAAIGQSAMPRLARYFLSNRPAFARLLKNMLLLGAVVGISAIGLALFFGPAFLRLVYRADYAQYATVFTRLMVAAAFAYVGSMLGYGMTAAQVFRPQVPLFLAAAAVTTLACWYLVPRLGLTGGAYAVLIGSVFSCAGSAYLVFSSFRSQPRSRSAERGFP
jgi:O-antigen/teichoic acid export membrane protein